MLLGKEAIGVRAFAEVLGAFMLQATLILLKLVVLALDVADFLCQLPALHLRLLQLYQHLLKVDLHSLVLFVDLLGR